MVLLSIIRCCSCHLRKYLSERLCQWKLTSLIITLLLHKNWIFMVFLVWKANFHGNGHLFVICTLLNYGFWVWCEQIRYYYDSPGKKLNVLQRQKSKYGPNLLVILITGHVKLYNTFLVCIVIAIKQPLISPVDFMRSGFQTSSSWFQIPRFH